METNKRKQTQGVACVNKPLCCGFYIMVVEPLHNNIPSLDKL